MKKLKNRDPKVTDMSAKVNKWNSTFIGWNGKPLGNRLLLDKEADIDILTVT